MGQSSRLFTRSTDARSVGFLVAGASHVVAQHMLAAVREQPPLPRTRDVAGAWVAALYSHNERRGRDFAQRHAIIHYGDDLEDLLRRPEVQCVYVGSHPRHHAETVAAALQAHKHVLCEPPLALDAAEAAPLVQMAQNRGLVLALNHELLLNENIGELLGGHIRNTRYLPPERQMWRLQGQGGGVLWDRTLHDVDILRYLLHVSPREVYVHGTQQTPATGAAMPQVYEEIVGHVVMTGGRVIQMHDSFVQSHVPVLVELYGTNGSIAALHCGVQGEGATISLRRGESERTVPLPVVNPYRASVANFLAAVRGDAPPLADGAGEMVNLGVMAAVERAAREGAAVKVRG
jgi:1,5-anhydro-D-fructose reductase (1,5-anhydro-D-mannitol-forming)